jgi:hypothetical protein
MRTTLEDSEPFTYRDYVRMAEMFDTYMPNVGHGIGRPAKKSIHNAKRKRSNMNHVSRQLRRKHRRAKK